MSAQPVIIGVLDDLVEIPAEEGVTKVGGIPHWIAGEPEDIKNCRCERCGTPLALLVSADCPVTPGYDRIVYLYICPRCGQCAKVWRQKAKTVEKEDIIEAPPKQEPEPTPAPEKKPATKADLLASLSSFQAPTKKGGKGKGSKPPPPPKKQYEKGVFPAYYVYIFDEPEAEVDMSKVEMSTSAGSVGSMSEMGEEDRVDVDPILIEYNERMSRVPDQILRYDRGGEPLLQEPMKNMKVPPCPKCGAPRIFEFEVIPTIIYNIAPENDEIDFGPLLVFTCSKDCGEGTSCEHCIVCPP